MGATPGTAYTPGLPPEAAGGVYGTGLGLSAPPGVVTAPAGPDYSGVLVKLPGGGVGVGGRSLPNGDTEATPLEGGAAVVLTVVELVPPGRKDRVKVVCGERIGLVGEVMTFDGGDAVLMDGEVIDRTLLGKLAPPPPT